VRAAGAIVAALLLSLGGGASAQQAPSLILEELTWPELRDAIKAGKTTILVPIGGTEQNGPHMVLGKHNARARVLASDIARELGNAIVAPVIAYVPEGAIDPPTGHMKFPGTISIPDEAFEKTLEGAARSFRHHGFRDVVLLGEHGGYRRSLQRVADRLNTQWAKSGVRVHPLPEYYVEYPHAGKEDTSLSLAFDGLALVRAAKTGKEALGQGAAGDPTGASAQAGSLLHANVVKRTVEAIRKATARPVK
jgi:creatinine amidohydrolase/Fe(II)-dependent formamide hydrolase-like protein